MPEPISTSAFVVNVLNAIGGREQDGSKKTFFIAVFSGLCFLFFFLFVCVYILLAPAWWFMGNDLIQEFKNKYDKNVIIFQETEQIGEYPMPCTTTTINSPYGSRDNPTTSGGGENHTGIDFGTSWHSPIVAITDGEVVKTGTHKLYGRYVLIKHDEFYTFYAHLSRIYVMRKQEVTAYQVIGKEGGDPEKDPSPGRSTGHHLHFEIRTSSWASSHVDPYDYILKPPEPPEEEEGKETDKEVTM